MKARLLEEAIGEDQLAEQSQTLSQTLKEEGGGVVRGEEREGIDSVDASARQEKGSSGVERRQKASGVATTLPLLVDVGVDTRPGIPSLVSESPVTLCNY